MRSFRHLIPMALAAGWLLGCAHHAPPPATPPAAPVQAGTPLFMWQARGPHGTAWLLGSVHMWHDRQAPLHPAMNEAFARADTLVVEVNTKAIPPAELQAMIMRRALLPPGQRLAGVLSPATYEALGKELARYHVPLSAMTAFKPWMVYLTLGMLQLKTLGYDGEFGVDRQYLDRAAGEGKAIVGLEEADFQIQLLDGLAGPLQDLLVQEPLAGTDELKQQMEGMLSAWQRGDAAALWQSLTGPLREHPEWQPVYDRLFTERNQAMAQKLAGMLAQDRTLFVVVGAGHLVGPQGLVALLGKQGFTVEQVRVPKSETSAIAAPAPR